MEIGIVGLPNVGKSTLFNALLKKQVAYVANFPFATVEPNVGVVPVPDDRLAKLAKVAQSAKIVNATVKFVDIAGLVKGASEGAGLGNKFLSHIREVDAICHVVRAFRDENIIREGSTDPKSDYEIVRLELELSDLESKSKREAKKNKIEEPLQLFADKPEIVVYNVDEKDLAKIPEDGNIYICAKLEDELASLSEQDAVEYLKQLGLEKSGLERLIIRAFEVLGLQTFLTAGEIEARAWTINRGMKAPQAAGVIHTDFEKHFIKADVINWDEFVRTGGWTKAREMGKVRQEGREYIMQEGDTVEFKVGV